MSFFSPLFSMLECGYAINDKQMNVKRQKRGKLKKKQAVLGYVITSFTCALLFGQVTLLVSYGQFLSKLTVLSPVTS